MLDSLTQQKKNYLCAYSVYFSFFFVISFFFFSVTRCMFFRSSACKRRFKQCDEITKWNTKSEKYCCVLHTTSERLNNFKHVAWCGVGKSEYFFFLSLLCKHDRWWKHCIAYTYVTKVTDFCCVCFCAIFLPLPSPTVIANKNNESQMKPFWLCS